MVDQIVNGIPTQVPETHDYTTYTISYAGDSYFADTVWQLDDKEKTFASDYAQNLTLYLQEIEELSLIHIFTSIICQNLSFSFSDHSPLLLNSLNFELKVDNIYGVLAENGKGKTTLLNILLGLYNERLPKGHIYFNHIDIKDIDTSFLRKNNITYLSQTNAIIPGTYKENVTILLPYQKGIDGKKIHLLSKLLNITCLLYTSRCV